MVFALYALPKLLNILRASRFSSFHFENRHRNGWGHLVVTRKDREELHKHRGGVVWFTSLPGSGKSTIAHLLEKVVLLMSYMVITSARDSVLTYVFS